MLVAHVLFWVSVVGIYPCWVRSRAVPMAGGKGHKCAVCGGGAVVFCEVDDVFLYANCDREVHEANPVARRHEQKSTLFPLAQGELRRMENQGGACPIEALAIREDSTSPPYSNGGWQGAA
jgi:hypothetical protein